MSDDIKTKMWKAMSQSPKVMVSLVNKDMHAEPMYAQLDSDADGRFWFYTTKDNRIAQGGKAMIHFASKGHDVFACIRGTLVTESRSEIIDKYWSNPVEAWYEEGKDDPSLLMLRFELDDAEIWDADPSIKGVFKMLTGKNVQPEEMGDHIKVDL
ncbi:MAG: general stress protein [Alteromonas sp.]|jgi:general stress protein 26|uniref:pyridoxamine 5'-phosphate oxidase family protein n=1 Tax=Alteromonas sp. MB-3u-76 TaxID=2058133 RepID=UPI000C319003|nr:pyridoxamine 5'-phosphate oxidase family protein [Alteromonas sp. MB-3u-76]AUC87896.1 general stress protein [Alteromonas sp. MB-3u-76]MAI63911.1 general stress protein [Alteromonas sp.]